MSIPDKNNSPSKRKFEETVKEDETSSSDEDEESLFLPQGFTNKKVFTRTTY